MITVNRPWGSLSMTRTNNRRSTYALWFILHVTAVCSAGGFAAAQPITMPSPVPVSKDAPTFEDSFASFSLHRTWQPGDRWQLVAPDTPNGRGGPKGNEVGDQFWVNPFNPSTHIQGLYRLSGGKLQLGLMPTPSLNQSYINGQGGKHLPFVGALLNSSQTSYQKYGYWECIVRVPRLPGFTFQFDLENVQITRTWPPEIDLRILTDQSNLQTVSFSVATTQGAQGTWTTGSNAGFDATIDHAYGISWQPDYIAFYIDDVERKRLPTPSGPTYHSDPMFMFALTAANYENNGRPALARLPAYATISKVSVYRAKSAATPASALKPRPAG
jgi:serralysin